MQQPECSYLFVYGSLRQGFNSPAYQYVSQYFELVAHGKVQGKLYDLGDYPAAVPTHEDWWITGELYRLKHEDEWDWAIGQLDDYEGVDATEDEASYYSRQITSAQAADGQRYETWVYWYTGSVAGKPQIPSGDVLEYLANRLGKG